MEPMTQDARRVDASLKSLSESGASAVALSQAYQQAAGLLGDDPLAVRFHLTQAYVFALEAGDEVSEARLASELRRLGGL